MSSQEASEIGGTVYVIGWFCAFLLPIVGLVIGGLCMVNGPKREGSIMVAVSILSGCAIVALSRSGQAY